MKFTLYLLLFGNNCTSKKNLSHHYSEKGFFSYTCTRISHSISSQEQQN